MYRRSIIVREVRVSRALTRSGLPEYDYSLNPYIGCLHGCVYCYAVDFTRGEPRERWGEVVYVKKNLPEVLEREVRRLERGVVGVSTVTDPYQPIENRYMITRRSLEILLENRFRVSIQTRSALIERDIDILERHRDLVDVGFTITTMDPSIKRYIEPWSPHPSLVARALRRVSGTGVQTWVFIGPIIPGLNDSIEGIREIIGLARETGSEVVIDLFHRHPGSIEMMRERLGTDRVRDLLERLDERWWRELSEKILYVCSREGVKCVKAEDYWREMYRRRTERRGIDIRVYMSREKRV